MVDCFDTFSYHLLDDCLIHFVYISYQVLFGGEGAGGINRFFKTLSKNPSR